MRDLVGAAALFVLSAVAVGIWDAIFSIETQPYQPVFALIFTAVGAAVPIVILRNRRIKHRLPRFAKNPAPTEPPLLPDLQPIGVNTTYGVTELKEAATATAPSPTSAGQPQSPANGTQNTEAHRQHTQHARAPHEAANQPSPKTQPKVTALENSWRSQRSGVRALKQLLIIVGVIVAAILVVSIILSNSGPKLKVQARVGSLSIQNVGSEPITIRHLSVNDRPDCR